MKLTCWLAPFLVPCVAFAGDGAQPASKAAADVASISALAFGPDGVLFLGDSRAGAVHALDLGERDAPSEGTRYAMLDIEARIAALVGTKEADVMIHDLAADPRSRAVYLAVSRGRAKQTMEWHIPNEVADADILIRVVPDGSIELVEYGAMKRTSVKLPNPTDDHAHLWKPDTTVRGDAITDMAFVDGHLLVSGLSNEEFAAVLWRVPYPFDGKVASTTLEIFHGAHGEYETYAPIRAFVPYDFDGEPYVLASYLCTPFVEFEANALQDAEHIRGRTIAELGSGNYPVDMIVYSKGGEDRVLIANSNLPMMILKTADIASFDGELTTEPDGYIAGVPYEVRSGTGITQMDRLGDDAIVMLQRMSNGKLQLATWSTERF